MFLWACRPGAFFERWRTTMIVGMQNQIGALLPPDGIDEFDDFATPQFGDDPPAQVGWTRILGYPLCASPWPFTKSELDEIATKVAYPACGPWFDILMIAARQFIFRQRERDRNAGKPNARKEICRLKAACDELREAIRATGADAQTHLEQRMMRAPSPENQPFTIDRLSHALWSFYYANHIGLGNLPDVSRGGPRDKDHVRALFLGLKVAWKSGNGGQSSPPCKAFQDTCLEPLKRHGLWLPAEKAKQDKTRPGKQRSSRSNRNNSPKRT